MDGNLALPAPWRSARGLRRAATVATAAALAGLWLLLGPRTPDLAAQVYRSGLFIRDGFSVWDNHWYAGHHVPGYSLLFPPLAAALGPRVVGALAAIGSAVIFRRLAGAHFGPRAWLGISWFSVATVTDLLIGRLTFALGVALGLAAVLALTRRRPTLAATLSVGCAAASPVAGLFLALAGASHALAQRRWREGAALVLPALAVVGALGLAFPEGGAQPFSESAFWAAIGFTALAAVLIPGRERSLRVGAVLYTLATVVALVLPTPMGGNISRLSAMFAGPLLVCAAWGREPSGSVRAAAAVLGRRAASLGQVALIGATLALVAFQWNAPVREVVKGLDDRSVSAAYYRPLLAFLDRHAYPLARVEVPFTLTHWDAALLGRRIVLARGWERQLDTKYDPLFYRGSLSSGVYLAWLRRTGVRYVALPDVALDPSSRQEGALIRRGLPFLRPVWSDAHWRAFELRGAEPLVTGPARLTALGVEDFTVHAYRAGAIRVLVHFTPYWRIISGSGCVEGGPGDWTTVRATRPGTLRVSAGFSLDRVFDRGPRCTAGARG